MIKLSHIILFLISLLFLGLEVQAKVLLSQTILQGDTEYSLDDIIQNPEPISASLAGPVGAGFWSCMFASTFGDFKDLPHEDSNGKCTFNPKEFESWGRAKRYVDDRANVPVFLIRFCYTEYRGGSDTIDVKMALLPSKPQISDVSYSYVFDWETLDIWPNGYFSFKVRSDRATSYNILYSDSFLFEYEEVPFTVQGFKSAQRPDGDLIGYDADWGEFVRVIAYNYFGQAKCDSILLTTDYIYDEDVRACIESLRPSAGITDMIKSDGIGFKIENRTVTFEENAEMVYVYNTTGAVMGQWLRTKTVDLSYLPSGIYILSYCANNKHFTHKISII